MHKDKNRNKFPYKLTLLLAEELKDRLEKYCDKKLISGAALARFALEEYLDKREGGAQ